MGIFTFGRKKKAVISLLYSIRCDMEYAPNQPREPENPPAPVICTLAVGGEERGITLKKITRDGIIVETLMEYVQRGGQPSRVFSIAKGETIHLTEYGLCDATAALDITYIE